MKSIRDTDCVVQEVREELESAMSKFDRMASAHEGYAVILEELDELWEEIKKSPKKRDYAAMHAEAVQVAAMSLRFIMDVTAPALEGDLPPLPDIADIVGILRDDARPEREP